MFMFYFSIGLAILSGAAYQVLQKTMPHEVNPVVVVLVTYAAGIIASLPLFLLFPLQTSLGEALRTLTPGNLLLGLAVVGIELGFLLAYRSGWQIGVAPLVVNVSIALLLIPVSLLLFREQLSPVNLLGIAVCIIGFLMMNYKSS